MKIHNPIDKSSEVNETNQVIPSQTQTKSPFLLSLDVRSSQMKLLILLNEGEGDKVGTDKNEVKFCDYLCEPVKPGRFIEDCVNETRLKVSLFE